MMNRNMNKISRRSFLKGAGALSVGLIAWSGVRPAFAQTAPSGSAVTALTRFNVGDFEVTVLQDAVFPLDAAILGANAAEGEVDALLAASNLPTGSVSATVNVLLVNTGDQLVLLDTGNGAAAGGKLLPTLELIGVAPEDINAVILSHFHPDHINGVSAGGAPVFPNAAYYFPQAEWDFMQNAPADSPAAQTIQAATAQLQPVIDAGNLNYYAADAEIIPGISSVAAPGHSPGHSALLIQSGEAQLLNIVDTAINAVVSLARPDFAAAFDAIPEQAAESRRAVLGRAAEEGLQIFGYHFPFPGIGYVSADGDAFRFTPAF